MPISYTLVAAPEIDAEPAVARIIDALMTGAHCDRETAHDHYPSVGYAAHSVAREYPTHIANLLLTEAQHRINRAMKIGERCAN